VHGTRVYSARVGPKGPTLERFLDIKKKKKKCFRWEIVISAVFEVDFLGSPSIN
jgi:hypothetical protein